MQATRSAEYKQVTVLFADVVHSMEIAAVVGAERLREIMAELADRCAAVVKRYGGTVDKFTGDGIMAVFGAPVAMEDHAVRACLAGLDIQEDVKRLATEEQDHDSIELQLRVGLNSGQVIAGEIGSKSFGYTAIGEQVGLAQRMESVAAPGGVMLSASTARLVEGAATHGRIVVEGLDAAGMLRQKGLSGARARRRGLSDAALATPRRHLSYKTGWYGSQLVVADRWFPSSKKCHACAHVQDIRWAQHRQCDRCSAAPHQRDDNASINLARYEDTASVVGPVGAAVKRGADRKTRPSRAGGREARKGTGHPAGEQPRDGCESRDH